MSVEKCWIGFRYVAMCNFRLNKSTEDLVSSSFCHLHSLHWKAPRIISRENSITEFEPGTTSGERVSLFRAVLSNAICSSYIQPETLHILMRRGVMEGFSVNGMKLCSREKIKIPNNMFPPTETQSAHCSCVWLLLTERHSQNSHAVWWKVHGILIYYEREMTPLFIVITSKLPHS